MAVVTSDVYATFDGTPSATPAYHCLNIMDLWKPAKIRGPEGVVLAGASGRLAQAMVLDAATHVLEWAVGGDADPDGAIHADPRAGILANLTYLRTNIYDVPGTTDSTRTCVLHVPGGGTVSGPVQVRDFDWEWGIESAVAVMEIYLPAGRLT